MNILLHFIPVVVLTVLNISAYEVMRLDIRHYVW